MSKQDTDWPRSKLNSKFRSMPDEFMYKNRLWASWTSKELIETVETKFEFLPDDILLSGYVKSGITFLSEIVCLLVYSKGKSHDLQHAIDKVEKYKVHSRVPFIEEIWAHPYPLMEDKVQAMVYLNHVRESAKEHKEPRLIKTHLPYDSIECAFRRMEQGSRPKILYVYRNPKDVTVSLYHFYRGIVETGPFQGDWNEFFEMWMDGWVSGGDWRSIVPTWLEAVKTSELTPMFPVSYERLIKDRKSCIEEIFQFLYPENKLDDEVCETIMQRTDFEQMRKNKMTNYEGVDGFDATFTFMRRGQIGDWKNWFTVEQNRRFDVAFEKTVDVVNGLLSPQRLIFE